MCYMQIHSLTSSVYFFWTSWTDFSSKMTHWCRFVLPKCSRVKRVRQKRLPTSTKVWSGRWWSRFDPEWICPRLLYRRSFSSRGPSLTSCQITTTTLISCLSELDFLFFFVIITLSLNAWNQLTLTAMLWSLVKNCLQELAASWNFVPVRCKWHSCTGPLH